MRVASFSASFWALHTPSLLYFTKFLHVTIAAGIVPCRSGQRQAPGQGAGVEPVPPAPPAYPGAWALHCPNPGPFWVPKTNPPKPQWMGRVSQWMWQSLAMLVLVCPNLATGNSWLFSSLLILCSVDPPRPLQGGARQGCSLAVTIFLHVFSLILMALWQGGKALFQAYWAVGTPSLGCPPNLNLTWSHSTCVLGCPEAAGMPSILWLCQLLLLCCSPRGFHDVAPTWPT